jgi:serine/threonine protein kinase
MAELEQSEQSKLEKELFAKERSVNCSIVIHRPAWSPDPEKEQEEKERAKRKKKRRGKSSKEEEEANAKAAAAAELPLKEKVDVDIANILRGGYPKAKFNAEPADSGNEALNNTLDHDQDFSVVHLQIPEQFVRSIDHSTEWTVLSGKHGARAKMVEMAKLLRKKDRELEELEELLNSATASIQAFHLQQKELFDEFVALRSNYDDCKTKLRESVWVHSCKMSREFSVIPPLLRNAVEDNSTIEQYLLGGIIGTGESSKVRSCKLGMSGGSRKGGGGGTSQGSMAKRDLAVKVINKSRVRDVVALQRVANEIRVLREANNTNVMALFDVIHTDMRLYMVLERGDRDLFQLIMDSAKEDKHGPGRVDEEFAREIMRQLLNGVRYLHGMKVCHRDLKPENVVLVEKPGAPKPIIKIIDFGSCAATNGGLTLHDLCGTPGFVPPEMILEDAYDGFMGDVWSVGCIALEMTMGHQSFVDNWLPSYTNELVGNRKDFAVTVSL